LITVHDDPYTVQKVRNFTTSIETHTAIKNLDAEKYQIVFECIDGYKPMMPLQNFLSVNHFLPSGTRMHQRGIMVKIIKDGNEMKAAPFYLVYQGVSAKKLILNGRTT
jgi:hypothetical protein